MNNGRKGRISHPAVVFEVDKEEELMKYLLAKMSGKNKNNIKSLLTNKQVWVNGMVESQFNHILNPGDKVKVGGERAAAISSKKSVQSFHGFSIVYEDEHLIVIDKHAGVLSIATSSEKNYTAYSFLSKHVKIENPKNKIFIVHRLDRETSGLMLFAKTTETQHLLQDNWRDLVTERTYVAIAEGIVEQDEGKITSYLHENKVFQVFSDQNPENGKLAVTHYKVLKRANNMTLLEVHLDTGRKNQIRVHMQDLGHSLINDKKYGATTNPIDRLGLHAKVLAFTHPITNVPLRFDTGIPRKFSRLF